MTTKAKINPIQKYGKITGILILLLTVIAPFSLLYIPSTLIVPGDAAATASNIFTSQSLFRMGIASDSIIFLIEIMLSVLLYVLLKPVNKTFALIAGFSRLAMTVIQGMNILNHIFVLLLLNGGAFLSAFDASQIQAMVLLFLNAHQNVVLIWGLAFSLHLFILGTLIYKSAYIPKFVGILLIVAGACYLVQSFGNILLPQFEAIYSTIGFLSIVELALPLWLLIKGINVQKFEQRSLEFAG